MLYMMYMCALTVDFPNVNIPATLQILYRTGHVKVSGNALTPKQWGMQDTPTYPSVTLHSLAKRCSAQAPSNTYIPSFNGLRCLGWSSNCYGLSSVQFLFFTLHHVSPVWNEVTLTHWVPVQRQSGWLRPILRQRHCPLSRSTVHNIINILYMVT